MAIKVLRYGNRHSLFLMTEQMNAAFQQLLEAWKRRDDARRDPADIAELARARRDLDIARIEMSRTLTV
jgi:hypothetical protein